ncbi:hypothetical protein CROQUDRAFT_668328 [Cronartium quercuum f. sp. fusiforme G11]|uniref:Carrier domain-containing protein n=1 Tax=Cronartium quercuum f. sp. fusiforme G11 TaxID=708437 RepID=A0A9P6TGF9_9BASI|nr:hypothetical protein CROQUDRAFT_668328 [Cronartium quercuum f. sp. fusiforme G11]
MTIDSNFFTAAGGFEEIPSPFITLDVAEVLNCVERNPALSINHLLDLRASSHPNLKILASDRFANYLLSKSLAHITKSNSHQQLTVGLLAQSGPDFLITVLACLRLGLAVLLLAPQLPVSQVFHLLKVTKSSHLLLFESSLLQPHEIERNLPELSIIQLTEGVTTGIECSSLDISATPRWISYEEESMRPALIFHSSGTTGFPKPINTLHRDLSYILPSKPDEPRSIISFCTTPLYHGGMQDLFRSLNALSPIFFFPLHLLPVTPENICRAVQACSIPSELSLDNADRAMSNVLLSTPINVFLTVPYILRLMKATPDGLSLLRKMKYVCFGGASLEEELGDEISREGIKLVSRYGSSEFGYLLNSYRDFERDHEWNWLRESLTPIGEHTRTFKRLTDRTHELVITRGWPQMALGGDFYETGDLFESHPIKTRTWKYLGRADDVIVLSNGEKLNPNRAEDTLKVEFKNIISSALIFGARRTHCGLLVLLNQKTELWRADWADIIERVNQELPSFAQIWPEMIISLESGADPWPMSSKGLEQRQQILDLYSRRIDELYTSSSSSSEADNGSSKDYRYLTPEDLKTFVRDTVAQTLVDSDQVRVRKASLKNQDADASVDQNDDRDFFEMGLNSLKAIRIKTNMQKALNIDAKLLPMNLVYENATVSRLTNYLLGLKEQRSATIQHLDNPRKAAHALMSALTDKFSHFQNFVPQTVAPARELSDCLETGHTVILTGSTGSLGAHILNELLKEPAQNVQSVVCLVRKTDHKTPRVRVLESFEKRMINTSILEANENRLRFCHFDLSDESLGLCDDDIAFIMGSDRLVVIHAAWTVDFLKPLSSFGAQNLRGLQSLLNLFGQSVGARSSTNAQRRAKFIFCSSLSSVSNRHDHDNELVEEIMTHDPKRAIEIGYAQSKWVAEEICDRFLKIGLNQFGIDCSDVELTVMRLGQLSGDLINGVWNTTEYWPLLISSCRFTGCLPTLEKNPSWLPVDICAKAMVKYVITLTPNTHTESDESSGNETSSRNDDSKLVTEDVNVYHVFNTDTTVSWDKIVEMIREEVKTQQLTFFESIGDIRLVETSEWLEKLSASESDPELNPSRKLLEVWKAQNVHENARIQSRRARADLPILAKCGPITQDWIGKMLKAMVLE